MVHDYGKIGTQNPPWRTFNEFFARRLVDPKRRPIDPQNNPADPNVIVSPADSAFDGSWTIDDNAEVTFNTINSKGLTWPISELLADSSYGKLFAGGTFAHAFLSPANYHRQHAPVAGKVVEAKVVHGQCYLQVVAKPSPTTEGHHELSMVRRWSPPTSISPASGAPNNEFDAPDTPGYQFLQTRGIVIIKSHTLGYVAVLPMGMAQVSSVVLTCEKGDELKKGDEISYFQFGGSDIVLVFQKDAHVNWTAKVKDPPVVHYVGQEIATASPI